MEEEIKKCQMVRNGKTLTLLFVLLLNHYVMNAPYQLFQPFFPPQIKTTWADVPTTSTSSTTATTTPTSSTTSSNTATYVTIFSTTSSSSISTLTSALDSLIMSVNYLKNYLLVEKVANFFIILISIAFCCFSFFKFVFCIRRAIAKARRTNSDIEVDDWVAAAESSLSRRWAWLNFTNTVTDTNNKNNNN